MNCNNIPVVTNGCSDIMQVMRVTFRVTEIIGLLLFSKRKR